MGAGSESPGSDATPVSRWRRDGSGDVGTITTDLNTEINPEAELHM
jgi:hypothetical protein